MKIIAKTFQGLEDVLAEEIIALGGNEVEIGRRMVSYEGDLEMVYRSNIFLRTALRILVPIATFQAASPDEVYEQIKALDWSQYISSDSTFSIDSVVFSDEFRHSKFVTYRAKDAIVDYFMEKEEKRPSVRISGADLALNLHIAHHTCTLSLDSSGESLHKRGWRADQFEAPLNEVLAAGMILKTGWKGESNFVDPLCGSGTLLIEAALIAMNIAPGIFRKDFAFEKWKNYNEELFDKVYNDDSGERDFNFKIYGSDISPLAIQQATENAKSAGVIRCIELEVKPLQQLAEQPAPGIMVSNPPYGERISTPDLLGLYEMIGERLKHAFKGYSAWIISYREECFEKIGLKPSEKIDLMNGSLECQFRKYEIFEGKYKEFKQEGGAFTKRYDNDARYSSNRPTGSSEGFREGDTTRSGGFKYTPSNSEKKSYDGERKPFDRERKPYDGERKPYDRDKKPFDRERKPYDGERKPFDRDKKPFDRERKPYDGERKPFDRDKKPFDRERKPYDGERKPFDRDKKPFDRERKPYDGERKPFDRDKKPFDRERKPYDGERKPFDRDKKPFDRERKPYDGERKPYDRDKKPFDRERKPYDGERNKNYVTPIGVIQGDEVPRWKKIQNAQAELGKESKTKRERFYGERPPVSDRFKTENKKTRDE